ncbi:protein of unknown function DUF395, YeeE/YedE [Desulfosudis oleivorans Hxd3]|uniref:YeeE/YedE family protein n=1 Tax=Desulfosudis oleivorans (strain DSM 6200 / JCM 39069 / Hxd3) TaxID=96561 RepID=A8ZZ45_DESOH|nr:protein of unknown function DUF395, YeeE/YedE [Desulfosudis oleivorans Hxd3]
MSDETNNRSWSPYLAGALSGLVLILSVWVAGKYFGASTTFVRSVGMIEQTFRSEAVATMDYFVKTTPKIDWQWTFVVGILIGSFIAAMASGTFKLKAVPPMWESRFGASPAKRGVVAFCGGIVAMFGARLADG